MTSGGDRPLSVTEQATTCMLHGFVMAQAGHKPQTRRGKRFARIKNHPFAQLQISGREASKTGAFNPKDPSRSGEGPSWEMSGKTISDRAMCAFLRNLHTTCHSGLDGKNGLVHAEWKEFVEQKERTTKMKPVFPNEWNLPAPMVNNLLTDIPNLATTCLIGDPSVPGATYNYQWCKGGQLASLWDHVSDRKHNKALVALQIERVYTYTSKARVMHDNVVRRLKKLAQKVSGVTANLTKKIENGQKTQNNVSDDNVGNISLYAQSTSSSDESLLSTPWFMYSLIGGCGVLLVVGVALCARRRRRASRRQRW